MCENLHSFHNLFELLQALSEFFLTSTFRTIKYYENKVKQQKKKKKIYKKNNLISHIHVTMCYFICRNKYIMSYSNAETVKHLLNKAFFFYSRKNHHTGRILFQFLEYSFTPNF